MCAVAHMLRLKMHTASNSYQCCLQEPEYLESKAIPWNMEYEPSVGEPPLLLSSYHCSLVWATTLSKLPVTVSGCS